MRYIFVRLHIFHIYLYTLLVKKATDFTWPQGRFIDDQNFKKIVSNKSRFSLNFENPRNFFFIKSANFSCLCFTKHSNRKCSLLKKKMGGKRPDSLVFYIAYYKLYLSLFIKWIAYVQEFPSSTFSKVCKICKIYFQALMC